MTLNLLLLTVTFYPQVDRAFCLLSRDACCVLCILQLSVLIICIAVNADVNMLMHRNILLVGIPTASEL